MALDFHYLWLAEDWLRRTTCASAMPETAAWHGLRPERASDASRTASHFCPAPGFRHLHREPSPASRPLANRERTAKPKIKHHVPSCNTNQDLLRRCRPNGLCLLWELSKVLRNSPERNHPFIRPLLQGNRGPRHHDAGHRNRHPVQTPGPLRRNHLHPHFRQGNPEICQNDLLP